MVGRATDITDCSVLMESNVRSADETPLSIQSAGDEMVADELVQPLTLRRFISR